MELGKIFTEKEAELLNVLTLAYVGDAAQSLYVRHNLAANGDFKAGELHKRASGCVNAHTQAETVAKLWDKLTEKEQSVYLRGRNAKTHHKAKNQSGADYRKATGFEALIGYLYLTGDYERMTELLGEAYED